MPTKIPTNIDVFQFRQKLKMVGIHFFSNFCAFWSSMASSGALFYLFPSPPSLHINASLAHNGDPGAEIPLIQLRSIGQVSSQDMWQSM